MRDWSQTGFRLRTHVGAPDLRTVSSPLLPFRGSVGSTGTRQLSCFFAAMPGVRAYFCTPSPCTIHRVLARAVRVEAQLGWRHVGHRFTEWREVAGGGRVTNVTDIPEYPRISRRLCPMFLCAWHLPSFRPRLCASHRSTHQNVAGGCVGRFAAFPAAGGPAEAKFELAAR